MREYRNSESFIKFLSLIEDPFEDLDVPHRPAGVKTQEYNTIDLSKKS